MSQYGAIDAAEKGQSPRRRRPVFYAVRQQAGIA
jgi:hypothetical protein